jgi:radical SAM protein with 4Fe4S-binding SPASM domain
MVTLDPKIIVRTEKQYYLLYNGENLGLITVSKETFERCITQNNWENQDEKFQEWLYKNDFLTEKATKSADGKNSEVDEEPPKTEQTFYELKSEISPLNILWALSPKCNLTCVYCFPDAKTHRSINKSLSTEELGKIADKIVESKALKVTLSGGECLLLKELWGIVKKLKAAGITVAILSNGIRMPDDALKKIKENKLFVGVSLDGPNEAVNSQTRGPLAFKKTISTIKRLLEDFVPTTVMVTVTKHNFCELERIVQLLSDLGVSAITFQDLRPFANKKQYDELRLTAKQEKELKHTLSKLVSSFPKIYFNTSELLIFNRSNLNGNLMQCPAGDNFAYIDFDGNLFPCTSLPTFKLGNLLEENKISKLWQNSESIKLLRRLKESSLSNIPECQTCTNKENCDGGCRGDALFYTDNLLGLPSRCPKALENL